MTEVVLSYAAGPITKIIGDVVALGVSYVISFVGCDLMFNHFRIQQSLRSAYWFFLGPFLWKWGKAIPWVYELLKNLAKNQWNKIEDKLKEYLDSKLPWNLFVNTGFNSMVAKSVDKQSSQILDNFQYLTNTLGKYQLQ